MQPPGGQQSPTRRASRLLNCKIKCVLECQLPSKLLKHLLNQPTWGSGDRGREPRCSMTGTCGQEEGPKFQRCGIRGQEGSGQRLRAWPSAQACPSPSDPVRGCHLASVRAEGEGGG